MDTESDGPLVERIEAQSAPRRPSPSAIALIAIAVIAVVVLGYFAYRAFSGRMQATQKLDEATQLVEEADVIVVRADEVIMAKVTPELAPRARGAADTVDEARGMLDEATRLIGEARPGLDEASGRRAQLLEDAAEARKEMLARAPTILDLNAQAASAMPLGEEGWSKMLEADKLSDTAVASYNKLTKPGVTESQRLNRQAAEVLTTARDRFDSAEQAFSAAPFEEYLAYVDTRIRLNELSQQSDAAWLRGDLAKANSVIATYNAEDKRAVEQAKALPASPNQAIADAYERTAKVATDAYYAARKRAVEADNRLRDL